MFRTWNAAALDDLWSAHASAPAVDWFRIINLKSTIRSSRLRRKSATIRIKLYRSLAASQSGKYQKPSFSQQIPACDSLSFRAGLIPALAIG